MQYSTSSEQAKRTVEQMTTGIIEAQIAGLWCMFLIDSGAQVNTVTAEIFAKLIGDARYKKDVYEIQAGTDLPLKAYATSGHIQVVATFYAHLFVTENRPRLLEKFYVVKEKRSLLSRPTAFRYSILMLGLQVPLRPSSSLMEDCSIGAVCTDKAFPKFNMPPVKISYDADRPPCRNVFTNIPIAIKSLVEQRLQDLVKTNIIERVEDGMDTSFCSSLLVVPKGVDDIRLVIDLRGPNRYIHRTPFLAPTLETILSDLDGAQWFSTIDLSQAFFHIELDQASRHLTNFYTEFGMFRYVRLPFGLTNAPDIFQESLQRKVLAGCSGCKNYLDDIIVYGTTKTDHDNNLKAVLACLKNHNVKLNESKCNFGQQSVKFLGFTISAKGWLLEDEKVAAIQNFRRPESCSEVKSFLGLITFVDRFIIHRATNSEHLRKLSTSDQFYWNDELEKEFKFFQTEALQTIKRLGYYSTKDRTELFVDASPIGVGAVLTQFDPENQPRIIACASKVLTESEKRYPQTQKEALAVVWGVERFTFYLLARFFTIRTDSEANQFIFNSEHRLGRRAVTRAENWALRLQPYYFKIERVPGDQNIADALSRLIHASQSDEAFDESADSHYLFALDPGYMNITWNEIESESEADGELNLVREAINTQHWPAELRAYEPQRKNLHVLGDLVFRNEKVVLPGTLRLKALKSAHSGHVGEVATKRIMREYFWWPRMSEQVSRFIRNCETCTLLSRRNPPVPLASRELPEGPWEHLQIDFLNIPNTGTGEFLVVVDLYSRYLSVVEMKSMDADATNKALCEVFQTWGWPVVIQSDNGPPFQSEVFVSFWSNKGVQVRKSIPYSPQSNGGVERQNIGIIKAVSAAKLDGRDWRNALQEFVHRHNTLIPLSRLNVTPFELMTGWKYRGTFPCLWKSSPDLDRQDICERDAESKFQGKNYADRTRGAKESNINIGDVVLLAQPKRNKTDPTFPAERYTVVAREGAKVVVVSKTGVQYARNVQEVKIAPQINTDADQLLTDNPIQLPDGEDHGRVPSPPRGPETNTPAEQEIYSRNLRQRGTMNRPVKYKDYILHIFH